MKKVAWFCVLVLVFSCVEKIIEPPKDLIPQEKLEQILYDLAILNAAKNTSFTVLKTNGIETMPFLYAKYNIDSVQLATSDAYYASMPVLYDSIYSHVDRLLLRKKDTVEAIIKRKSDSAMVDYKIKAAEVMAQRNDTLAIDPNN